MTTGETRPLLETNEGQTDRQLAASTDITDGFPDSLPGANHGKNLSWSSAYILVVSRVIGSGIFATPGSIVKSTGSVGLTFLVWIAGTILAACGLSISMEFGCMLPRSGGDKVDKSPTITPKFIRLKDPVSRCTWSIPILGRDSSLQL
jgi:amino acid permease